MSDDPPELLSAPDDADWAQLAPHAERDALILVSSRLDLATVGKKVASDDRDSIESWIQQGLINRPTREQLDAWKQQPQKKFSCLIVQPFVLAQEIILH